MQQCNPKTWQVVLTPHRSLSRQGVILVMGLVAVVNLAVGTMFFMIGAWPVAGFAGLDVLFMWWAFRANFADARRAERICITEHELILEHLSEGSAPRRQTFVRRWVRLHLEEDRERELVGGLFLVSHGNRTPIGHFLPPNEKRELAGALRAALAMPHI